MENENTQPAGADSAQTPAEVVYEDGTSPKANPEERKFKKTPAWRGDKKVRLAIIGGLIIIAAVLAIMVKQIRLAMIAVVVLLLAAFGMEASDNDYDLGTLMETKSFSESKVVRDDSGNLMLGTVCSEETYNCNDFANQSEAQEVFNACGWENGDVHGLDRDGDGVACESLSQ